VTGYQNKVVSQHSDAQLEREEWRSVVGWHGWYSVSSLGRVRRDAPRGRYGTVPGGLLKLQLGGLNNTYVYARLHGGGRNIFYRVAGMVAAAFIGPRPDGLHINHKDGNRHNNAASNLEYVTRRQNEDHAVENALHAWGERHGMAKLTEAAVRHIRVSQVSNRVLADGYGVQIGTIRAVRNGLTWRHLK
jgi:HNH endonuclease/NUMOD4 motif-containing protein